jgi:hypothetical protein
MVMAAQVLLPALERPAWAQATPAPYAPPPGYAPPPPAGYAPPPPGYAPPPPGYAPPPPGYTPPLDAGAAAAQGVRDAQADVSGTMWFFLGCLGLLGVLIAYVAEPSPPPARMIGRSAEFVNIYTAAYKTEGKSIQGRNAIYGCLVFGGIEIALLILWLAAFSAAASNTTVQ